MESPEKPDITDCCNSGCVPCIFDIYEKQLNEYKSQKKSSSNFLMTTNILKMMKYSSFKLISVDILTVSVNLYTFEYPVQESSYVLNFRPGQYFILKGNKFEGESPSYFSRPYTPIICTFNNPKCIKDVKYNNELFFQVAVNLEPNGDMSKYYKNLKIGDLTLWRGPYGNFDYKNTISNNKFTNLICFSQGVGITPIFCILDSILDDETDETIILLNCCFKDIDSIILRREINRFNQFWNFHSNIYLANHTKCDCNFDCDCFAYYGEIIYKHKLEKKDVKHILEGKKLSECYALICGSESFGFQIESSLLNLNFYKSNIYKF